MSDKVREAFSELRFEYLNPASNERRVVYITSEDVTAHMDDVLFDKLTADICQCEPVGETNVVDCNCDEYAENFELCNTSIVRQPAPVTVPDANYGRMFRMAVDSLIAVGEAAGVRAEDQLNGSSEIIMAIETIKDRRDSWRKRAEMAESALAAPNGWQAGYDKGRQDGTKTRLSELEQERRINRELRDQLREQRADYAVGAALQRAAGELPEGFDIRVEVERGAGTVRLYGPEGDEIEGIEGDTLADEINEAIDVAIESQACANTAGSSPLR